jgi:Tfp pilus assembly protein PilX
MLTWRRPLGNEHGVALILSLMTLLVLTGLLMAFLASSALEPQISRNLADSARARYLAETGIEVGFNLLVNTSDALQSFTPALAGATGTGPWVTLINSGTLANVTTGGAAAETTFAGTYTVSVRNDSQAGDPTLTGQSNAGETLTTDTNKIVIMRAVGAFNGATKTIEVVVKRQPLPPFPGAVNMPGLQSDTFINKTTFTIDGRDYSCSSNCDAQASWGLSGGTAKYGVSTNVGIQTNISKTYEANVESAVSGSSSKLASITGKNQAASGTTTGVNTIAADASLNPTVLQQYLEAVKSFPGTTILQSTQACPMQLTGSASPTSTPTLTNGCTGPAGVNQTLNLGSRSDPRLVYFRGDTDPSSLFTGLSLNSGIKGAGILVIEDGDLKNFGNFTWDGVVIVTGHYVGAGFMSGSNTTVHGALVSSELEGNEASGYEFYLDANASGFIVEASKQMIDLVQLTRGTHTLTNWREY